LLTTEDAARRCESIRIEAVEFGIELADTLLTLVQFCAGYFGFGFQPGDLLTQQRRTRAKLRGVVLKSGNLVAEPDSFGTQLGSLSGKT
jgi:hypothetical protein